MNDICEGKNDLNSDVIMKRVQSFFYLSVN